MADKSKAGHSTGPRTRAGKQASSLNAVTHGMRASTLLLPHENPDDYDALLHELVRDVRPVGALEQLLVERIAGVVWRRQRMEGAEHTILTAAQMHPVTYTELEEALELERETLPDWMYRTVPPDPLEIELIGSRGTQDRLVRKPLPDWMLEQDKMPSAVDGEQAAKICHEWEKPDENDLFPESEDELRRQYPVHWQLLTAEAQRMADGDLALALKLLYNPDSFIQGFYHYMRDQHEKHYWVAYCHRHRDKMDAAFRLIRVRRMLAAWDPEKAHRYHTMLDNQLFKLLRELREVQAWRLSHLDLTDDATPFSTH